MPNRLAAETSPYLLQHANNPVDWYPWGPEAFERARREDKPILLSVGYSACHWCHVMEHESFEDEAIAAVMNQLYINVKVDREERPDVDDVYMRAVQAMNRGQGGWPMTVFMTPEGRPFFGGTYFPNVPRYGMPSFPQVLEQMSVIYRTKRSEIASMTDEMLVRLGRMGELPAADSTVVPGALTVLFTEVTNFYDGAHGGFGGAPKFPQPGVLSALLAHHHLSGEEGALEQVTHTLDCMARGGMYDHLGGGFARYSVDAMWLIPHFEKMLYDNAQLISVYTDAYKLTKNPHYKRVVDETISYVLREMRAPEGGFAAAQDADSEGEEGKFFVWTPQTVAEVLGTEDGARLCALCQITTYGNFEHGNSVIRLDQPLERLSEPDRVFLERCFPRLYAARSQRVWPGRDDKVITAWNGLMIAALARAGACFERDDWIQAGAEAADFLLETVTVEGRLMRTYKDGRAHPRAFADDYAFLIDGLVELYQAELAPRWLEGALALSQELLDLFWDEEEGALFYTGSDGEELILRGKKPLGGAEPSANGVAAMSFLRLGKLCSRPELIERAETILKRYQALLRRAPTALGVEALALAWAAHGTREIGLSCPEGTGGEALLRTVHERYLPFAVWARQDALALCPWMEQRPPVGGEPTAYVCADFSCKTPVTGAEALGALLDEPA
jgi:uncharacterized protein